MTSANQFSAQFIASTLLVALVGNSAAAITTSQGQTWNHEPDAWARGNDADTSHFGWDDMEIGGKPFHGALRVLDDATPDLGGATTATNTRIYQGHNGIADPTPTANGHLSGTGNYYSFFDESNDTITGIAPASGAGGFTTVVLQLIGSPGSDGLKDLSFTIDESVTDWTLDKHLNNSNGLGIGQHWVEWWAPGANLAFTINITSGEQHRAIDAFQVDTYWTEGPSPALNSHQAIPEPVSGILAMVGALGGLASGWKRSR